METDGHGTDDRYPFRFTGSGGEYFRIWIVNVLLGIVTLYVYSAWAKVRTRRYFHGNTVLDGSPFEYHARPLQILAGRVVAVLLLLAVTLGGALSPIVSGLATVALLLVLPWALWRSTKFNARMTSYRNVRFDFTGSLGGMYLYTLLLPLLPPLLGVAAAVLVSGVFGADRTLVGALVIVGVLGFFALSPWIHRKLAGYLANHHRYGRAGFAAALSTRRFYGIYALTALFALLVLVLAGVAFAALAWLVGTIAPEAFESLAAAFEEESVAEDEAVGAFFGFVVVAVYASVLVVGYLVRAFFRSRVRNHLYGSTVVDGRVRLESTVRTGPLAWLLIGNLVLLVLTLGLAWAWVKVRLARFYAANTAVRAPEGLHAVVDDEHARRSALGEEIGDAFDMDVDVGF